MTKLVTLNAGAAELVLAPEIGGAIAGWHRNGKPVLRDNAEGALEADNARMLSSYPLVPFSNRVNNRRFTWDGASYDLPARFNGFAIHGVGWLRPWSVVAQDAANATLAIDVTAGADWPFAFHAEQNFHLTENALVCDISITNRHDRPVPAGIGIHPFFPRTEGTRLAFTAKHVWHNGGEHRTPVERTVPPAEWNHSGGKVLDDTPLDNCFADWGGSLRIEQPEYGYALEMTADPVFRHLIVFTPLGQPFFAAEPVSNMNDGLNRMDGTTDHGIFVIEPGETRRGEVHFRLSGL